MALTKKQKRFVEEYLVDLNATQAAIRAGYSPDTAREIGCENLTKPNIKKAIDKAMAELSRRTGVTQDRIIRELAKIAFLNPADVIDVETAQVLDTVAREDMACIQSVKHKCSDGEDYSSSEHEVRFYDKQKALELLGKHLGMFKDKVEIDGNIRSEKLSDVLSQIGGEGLSE